MRRFSLIGSGCLAVLTALESSCWAVESIDAGWLQSDAPALLESPAPDASIDSSIAALQLAQRQSSAASERLLVPLRDLAYALARAGEHGEAIAHLERAVKIVRANHGVFDLRQLELLKQLAASLTALGREKEAQEQVFYAVRAAEQNYGAPDLRVVPAYCDLGSWFADTGKFREARMAYQVALNIVDATHTGPNVAAVDPLLGFAASYMRQLSHPDTTPRDRFPGPFRGINTPKSEGDPRELAATAEHSLQNALRILDENPPTPTRKLIETLVQTGDWFQIKKAPAQALPYYQRAWRLIEAEAAEATPGSRLDAPVRVYYPTPLVASRNATSSTVETELQYVQLEFNVEADGSVSNARIVEHNTFDQYAADTLQAIREARFRPKFIDGEPVTTPAVTYRQLLIVSKPVR